MKKGFPSAASSSRMISSPSMKDAPSPAKGGMKKVSSPAPARMKSTPSCTAHFVP